MPEKRESFQQWSSDALKFVKDSNKEKIEEFNISPILIHVLSNTVPEFVDQLLKENKVEEAHLMAIFKGRIVSSHPPKEILKRFKKEYNLVNSQNLKAMDDTFWLFDLSLSLKYFDEYSIEECLTFVLNKYKQRRNNIFSHQFLLLIMSNIELKDENEMKKISETIVNMINSQTDSLSIGSLCLFYLLRKHKDNFRAEFILLLQELVKKITNEELIFKLIN